MGFLCPWDDRSRYQWADTHNVHTSQFYRRQPTRANPGQPSHVSANIFITTTLPCLGTTCQNYEWKSIA
ncbi:hypothetical protein M413DRAFT_283891 [Hebeloma cylindrosporum]|uniref:Uncharacterized protein n=1 Tax=Hebeloma cylindrosporum TaxID=76867 RepID=A0A0C2XFS6_HEBCY|nr:hypothetical protein M413DRAFT_283891 [Hebeloma cylindrosporum h7]